MSKDLAPSGKLRIGLNYSNFLLVIGDDAKGEPKGIAPDLGRELAKRVGMPFEFVKFDAAGRLLEADAVSQSVYDGHRTGSIGGAARSNRGEQGNEEDMFATHPRDSGRASKMADPRLMSRCERIPTQCLISIPNSTGR